ncbi:MAG: DUF1385 domain-containing protein [Lachnospiraceae bacterium]|nr:DUF1385 domain-containing protein [Lachnospiraceae bacterium]
MKRTMIGGQALFEGVMMKNNDQYATAIRLEDGTIDVQVRDYVALVDKLHLRKVPILRGVFIFLDSMIIGMRTLTYSIDLTEDENSDAELGNKTGKAKVKEGFAIGGTILLSLALALALFLVLPNFLANVVKRFSDSAFLFALVEGIVRLIIFFVYVWAIACMKEIKRFFQYHGAEHKTINCLEAGDELTPENVLKHSRFHKRCGTSFIVWVLIISIIFFMFIHADTKLLEILYRLVLVPVIAGVSYEFIRYAGLHDNKCVRIFSGPGFLVQRLTTREPDETMAEVAIKSVEAVMDWQAYQEAMRNGEIED